MRPAVARLRAIAEADLAAHLRSPLFATMLVFAALATLTINPAAMIGSGDAAVAGLRPFANSAWAMTQVFALTGVLVYGFLPGLLAGLAVLRDDEVGVSELLHATPLTASEYLVGKFLGSAATAFLALLAHVLFAVAWYELAPVPGLADLRGPFAAGHYLLPALLFAAPIALVSAALAIAVAVAGRSAMAVYALSTGLPFVTLGVFVGWRPPELDLRLDWLLQLGDPSGLRWLRSNIFAVDRGIGFYNQAPLALDATLTANRILLLLLAAAALAWAVPQLHRQRRGEAATTGRWRIGSYLRAATPRRRQARAAAQQAAATPIRASPPLATLGMRQQRQRHAAVAMAMARADLRELLGQPGFLAFGALAVATVLEFAATAHLATDTPTALSAATMAIGAVVPLTLLGCLLLLFAGVESLAREERLGLASFLAAYPYATATFVAGKLLVSLAVVGLLLALAFAASLTVLAWSPHGALEGMPLLAVYGLLVPTFLLWIAGVAAAWSALRQRAAVYALGIGALLASALAYLGGTRAWETDWLLWGSLRWSDFGPFDLDRIALVWNRLTLLALASAASALALALTRRREVDHLRDTHRPRHRTPRAIALGLTLTAALGLWVSLALAARSGSGGPAARERVRAYHRLNLLGWHGVAQPALAAMTLDLELEPAAHHLRVDGTYRMHNHTAAAIPRLAFTLGNGFADVSWTLDGNPVAAEDRAGLQILTPAQALAPGADILVGFSYRANPSAAMSRGAGERAQFILASGVLLDTLAPGFLPHPGYVADLGVEPSDQLVPATAPATAAAQPQAETGSSTTVHPRRPVLGSPWPFDVTLRVDAPAAYTVSTVGRRVSSETVAGRTTTVWQTDHPVRAVNLVAARWGVHETAGVEVFHHPSPAHRRNVAEIARIAAAARDRYGRWFHPYPWQQLRISETPNWIARAQGFPTNLVFSEGFGFLAPTGPGQRWATWVTAHEVAHQWWGNLVMPADAAGADVLIEGMANYATLLLLAAELGEDERIAYARFLEQRWAATRRADLEPALVASGDASRPGERSTVSDRGAWALWMLHHHLGEAATFAGLQAFTRRWSAGNEYPVLEDLFVALRPWATDPAAFDRFVAQWFRTPAAPELHLSAAPATAACSTAATIENLGSGELTVTVAAERGARPPASPPASLATHPDTAGGNRTAPSWQEARITVALVPGRPHPLCWQLDFRPERLVADPDVTVLQLHRERAQLELPGG